MTRRTTMYYLNAFNLVNNNQFLFFGRDFSLRDSRPGLTPEILASGSNKPNKRIYLLYASRSLYGAFEQSRKTAYILYIYLLITYTSV